MEFQQKVGVVVISTLTIVTIYWLPLSEYRTYLWFLAILLIGGDVFTTRLFPHFDIEEQEGITRNLCGAQPSLPCLVFTRLPIVLSAGLLYFTWIQSGYIIRLGSTAILPGLIPLMLAIGGMFAMIWNVSGFKIAE